MNPANDTPELTAYALGELHAHQAGEVHDLLAGFPAATSELEQIEAITDALRQGAPIPQDRLRPEQRHSVLHPAHIPRRITPMMPRPMAKKPAPLWPLIAGVLKAAAVVTVAGAAYLAGRHSEIGAVVSGAVTDSGTKETVKAEAGTPESVVPVQVQKAIAVTVNGEDKPALVPAPIVEPAAPEKAAVVVIAPEPAPVSPKAGEPAVKPAAPVVVQAVAAQIPVTTPAKDDAFINTSRQPVDEFTLRPASIRPLPVKADKAEMFASPAPARPAAESKDSARPKTSEIYIHSWKAEVASCPWNENNRLMRVTVQLPADQPAAMSQAAHPLQVAFDPATVREYRQLCERHLPAAELRSAGTHVVWYEFQPNGDTGKTVATVTLPNGRFTTQTVGPFDSSKLAVLDKGQSWQTAREDFIFESSVVAFGMLLRGVHQTPRLDHGLVLALAQKAKGADATGERGRFIRLVNEAKKAAGL